ncbi:MAG TPA: hypothetical protein VFD70_00085 [Anaerolineae bacterium]|nr:hypothetical protein [Anaerolineae bacterium]
MFSPIVDKTVELSSSVKLFSPTDPRLGALHKMDDFTLMQHLELATARISFHEEAARHCNPEADYFDNRDFAFEFVDACHTREIVLAELKRREMYAVILSLIALSPILATLGAVLVLLGHAL